jgi:hypothetical protein
MRVQKRVSVALAVLAMACAVPREATRQPQPAVDTHLPIRTDRSTYTLRRAAEGDPEEFFEIVAVYRNQGGRTVHLAECERMPPQWWLEKRIAGEWVRAYEPLCSPVAPERLRTLAPGATRTDTLRVRHYAGGYPRFSVADVAGDYRMVYQVYTSYDVNRSPAGERIPVLPVSNEFRVGRP